MLGVPLFCKLKGEDRRKTLLFWPYGADEHYLCDILCDIQLPNCKSADMVGVFRGTRRMTIVRAFGVGLRPSDKNLSLYRQQVGDVAVMNEALSLDYVFMVNLVGADRQVWIANTEEGTVALEPNELTTVTVKLGGDERFSYLLPRDKLASPSSNKPSLGGPMCQCEYGIPMKEIPTSEIRKRKDVNLLPSPDAKRHQGPMKIPSNEKPPHLIIATPIKIEKPKVYLGMFPLIKDIYFYNLNEPWLKLWSLSSLIDYDRITLRLSRLIAQCRPYGLTALEKSGDWKQYLNDKFKKCGSAFLENAGISLAGDSEVLELQKPEVVKKHVESFLSGKRGGFLRRFIPNAVVPAIRELEANQEGKGNIIHTMLFALGKGGKENGSYAYKAGDTFIRLKQFGGDANVVHQSSTCLPTLQTISLDELTRQLKGHNYPWRNVLPARMHFEGTPQKHREIFYKHFPRGVHKFMDGSTLVYILNPDLVTNCSAVQCTANWEHIAFFAFTVSADEALFPMPHRLMSCMELQAGIMKLFNPITNGLANGTAHKVALGYDGRYCIDANGICIEKRQKLGLHHLQSETWIKLETALNELFVSGTRDHFLTVLTGKDPNQVNEDEQKYPSPSRITRKMVNGEIICVYTFPVNMIMCAYPTGFTVTDRRLIAEHNFSLLSIIMARHAALS